MAGIVHHVEDHAGDVEVLEERFLVLPVATALGGVGLGVPHHLEGLGVGGHGPEALAVGGVLGRLVPPHRRLPPVDLEQVVGKAVGEVVEVGEVDRGELFGRGHAADNLGGPT